MQRIILDTNVLVSALIQRSYPFYIMDSLFAQREIQLCLSEALFEEYFQVLNRPKFARFPDFIVQAQRLLVDIKNCAVTYLPTERINLIRDEADNRLLELAQASEANFIITGNSNDFTMLSFRNTGIVSPRQYWEEHRLFK